MRARSGMTLLELVIAIAILAIMATAGGAAFVNIIDRQETIRTASAEVERAAALRETIRQWVLQGDILIQRTTGPRGAVQTATLGRTSTSIRSVSGNAATAQPPGVTAAASTGSELTVTTQAPNPLGTADARIRLFVDADESTPERGLTMEYQGGQGGNTTPLYRRQLDESVGEITVEFYDPRTNRWSASTQFGGTQTPIALRLTMIPAEGKSIARMLQVPLTIVFGEVEP
jgi:prepilin-type N-terminal cleavage/methylation domain-containing protein